MIRDTIIHQDVVADLECVVDSIMLQAAGLPAKARRAVLYTALATLSRTDELASLLPGTELVECALRLLRALECAITVTDQFPPARRTDAILAELETLAPLAGAPLN